MSQNIYNVLFQIGGGLLAGTLVDMIFARANLLVDPSNFPMVTVETFAQLVVDSYVAGLFLDTMANQALPLAQGIGSAPFFIFFFGCQTSLHKRINAIMAYARAAIISDVPQLSQPLAQLTPSSSGSSNLPKMNGSREGFSGGPYSRQPTYGGQAGNFNMYNPAANDYSS